MSTCGPGHTATYPCLSCLAKNSSAVRASRIRNGKQFNLNIPVDVLRKTLESHACVDLLAHLGEQIARAVMAAPRSGPER